MASPTRLARTCSKRIGSAQTTGTSSICRRSAMCFQSRRYFDSGTGRVTGAVMAAAPCDTWLPRNPDHTAPITIPTATSAAARMRSRFPRPTRRIFFRSPSTPFWGCPLLIRTMWFLSCPVRGEAMLGDDRMAALVGWALGVASARLFPVRLAAIAWLHARHDDSAEARRQVRLLARPCPPEGRRTELLRRFAPRAAHGDRRLFHGPLLVLRRRWSQPDAVHRLVGTTALA